MRHDVQRVSQRVLAGLLTRIAEKISGTWPAAGKCMMIKWWVSVAQVECSTYPIPCGNVGDVCGIFNQELISEQMSSGASSTAAWRLCARLFISDPGNVLLILWLCVSCERSWCYLRRCLWLFSREQDPGNVEAAARANVAFLRFSSHMYFSANWSQLFFMLFSSLETNHKFLSERQCHVLFGQARRWWQFCPSW